jgi:hypothetical protein
VGIHLRRHTHPPLKGGFGAARVGLRVEFLVVRNATCFSIMRMHAQALIFLLLGVNIALFTDEFNLAFTGAHSSLPASPTFNSALEGRERYFEQG